MTFTFKNVVLTAAVFLGLATSAHAATADYTIPNAPQTTLPKSASYTLEKKTPATANNDLLASVSGVTGTASTVKWKGVDNKINATSYNLGNGITLTLAGASIVNGSVTNQYAKPAGLSNTDPYLSVFGANKKGTPGLAIFSFANPAKVTTFSFTWGSMDAYNYIIVTNGKGKNYTISGADVIASSSLVTIAGKTTHYFSLTDLKGIAQIVLYSTTNSFEVANVSAVPLPGAFGFLGLGVVGLGIVRRRLGLPA